MPIKHCDKALKLFFLFIFRRYPSSSDDLSLYRWPIPFHAIFQSAPYMFTIRFLYGRSDHAQLLYIIFIRWSIILIPMRRDSVVCFDLLRYAIPVIFRVIMHKNARIPRSDKFMWSSVETFTRLERGMRGMMHIIQVKICMIHLI
jgi:hypothetical protein